MSKWRETELIEIVSPEKKSIISGPFGSNIGSRFFVEEGIPVIRGSNLSLEIGKKFVEDKFVFLSEEKAVELGTWANRGDLVFTAAGTIGQLGLIPDNSKYKRYIISNKQLRVTLNSEVVDKYFAYYWFASPFMKDTIDNCDTGSTIPLINLGVLKSLPISLPPLLEQRAIAEVLSSLDDKIDLLHRQNKTLEGMAEALFRQWFVEEAEEGWEEGVLDDVLTVKGGTTPSTKNPEYWDGDVPWTSPRDLSDHASVFLFDTDRKISQKGLAQIGSGLLPVGTVLLSSRAPIGYLAIADIPVAINQGYIGILDDKGFSNYFLYLWCKANMEEIKNAGNGSVFQEISKSNFKTLPIQKPPKKLRDNFDGVVGSWFGKINVNQRQIRNLEKMRDSLLPKLMSGEVRV